MVFSWIPSVFVTFTVKFTLKKLKLLVLKNLFFWVSTVLYVHGFSSTWDNPTFVVRSGISLLNWIVHGERSPNEASSFSCPRNPFSSTCAFWVCYTYFWSEIRVFFYLIIVFGAKGALVKRKFLLLRSLFQLGCLWTGQFLILKWDWIYFW